MKRNLVNLKTELMAQKYGEISLGYKITGNASLFYWFLEYIRKVIVCLVVVYTRTHLWLQMFSLFMLSIFIIISAGYIDARNSKFDRGMDVFNEAKIIFLMYHMMLFTDFLPDPIT